MATEVVVLQAQDLGLKVNKRGLHLLELSDPCICFNGRRHTPEMNPLPRMFRTRFAHDEAAIQKNLSFVIVVIFDNHRPPAVAMNGSSLWLPAITKATAPTRRVEAMVKKRGFP